MRFAYESYDIPKSPLDGSTEIYRPEIPIRLLGARGEFFSLALVDRERIGMRSVIEL